MNSPSFKTKMEIIKMFLEASVIHSVHSLGGGVGMMSLPVWSYVLSWGGLRLRRGDLHPTGMHPYYLCHKISTTNLGCIYIIFMDLNKNNSRSLIV